MNRALLIGINKYPGCPLRGCVNDITDIENALHVALGNSIARNVLLDGDATTEAMRNGLAWLVLGASPGDKLLFWESRHGAQVPTLDPAGEPDGLDEVCCPVDFDWTEAHMIRDKEFHRIFSAVPPGVEFVWGSDSCHSGDLSRNPIAPRHFTVPAHIEDQLRKARLTQRGFDHRGFARTASTGLNVALCSGCASSQTSADAQFDGRPNGAFTYAFLWALQHKDGRQQPLHIVMDRARAWLRQNGYEQVPQLEGSAEIAARPFLSLQGAGSKEQGGTK